MKLRRSIDCFYCVQIYCLCILINQFECEKNVDRDDEIRESFQAQQLSLSTTDRPTLEHIVFKAKERDSEEFETVGNDFDQQNSDEREIQLNKNVVKHQQTKQNSMKTSRPRQTSQHQQETTTQPIVQQSKIANPQVFYNQLPVQNPPYVVYEPTQNP